MHPAALSDDDLLRECSWSTQRRGGPGGQHRNKVETAVILRHLPSGVLCEANERRSQAENRRVALFRLRMLLAVKVRGELRAAVPSELWQASVVGGRIKVSENSAVLPAVLAELFDYLAANEFSLQTAADYFKASSSQLVKLLKKYQPAFEQLNAERLQRGLGSLK